MQIGRLTLKWDKRPRVKGWVCPEHGPLNIVIWGCPVCGANVSPRYHRVNRFIRRLRREG